MIDRSENLPWGEVEISFGFCPHIELRQHRREKRRMLPVESSTAILLHKQPRHDGVNVIGDSAERSRKLTRLNETVERSDRKKASIACFSDVMTKVFGVGGRWRR